VLAYLARSPYENVFLSDLVRNERSPSTRNGLFASIAGDRIAGVASFGRQLVLAAEPEALRGFADLAERRRGERMIVGPRDAVSVFWNLIRDRRPAPRLVRDRQLVMAVDAARLQRGTGAAQVRIARTEDAAETVNASAQMIEHELEYDPRRTLPEFTAGVRAMIQRERWWVGEWNGRVCFFCSIGPQCDVTAQLQGIWAPPDLRGSPPHRSRRSARSSSPASRRYRSMSTTSTNAPSRSTTASDSSTSRISKRYCSDEPPSRRASRLAMRAAIA
jgi:hypothetical protein